MSVPTLLTVDETAKVLRCHPQTVRHLYRGGELPYTQHRPKGQVFIWQTDVETYLASLRCVEGDSTERGKRRDRPVRSGRD
jgi:excisionase family DNA binding protein